MRIIQQTQEELQEQLNDQIKLLSLHSETYDSGNPVIAKSIATSVRLLVHDTANSRSLLGLLGLKSKKFFDTSFRQEVPKDMVHVGSFSGLLGIPLGAAKQGYVPYLDDAPAEIYGFVDFDDYWNRVIFVDNDNNHFTRKNIILALANKDGGAHVDPGIEKRYRKLTRENALGWYTSGDDKTWHEAEGPELAAVRQIGHEILRTLNPGYPNKKMIVPGDGVVVGGMGIRLGTSDPVVTAANVDVRNKVYKVGRNEPCPCGSGFKYKKCHGK